MRKPTKDYDRKFEQAKTVLEQDDFERSKSIRDIEETLSDKGLLKGLAGRARKAKVYRKARHSWRRLNRKEIGKQETSELPSYSTDFGGDKIHLHGYNHGFTWLPASDSVRKSLTATVRDKLNDGKKVLMEENLASHLKDKQLSKHQNFRELDDVEWAFPREIREKIDSEVEYKLEKGSGRSLKSKVKEMVPKAHTGQTTIARRILGGGKTLRIYSMAAMNRYFDHFSYDLANSIKNSRKNPDYALDHLNCSRANMMPLRLEEDLISENAKFDVLTTQRSIYQAEQALREEGDTHLIVGTGHVPQIEDYVDRVKENGRKATLPPT